MDTERLAAWERELAALHEALADPQAMADHTRRRVVARREKDLHALVDAATLLASAEADVVAAHDLLGEAELAERDSLRHELEDAQHRVETLGAELRSLLLPRDPNAGRNVIVEIRGAEGGEEANLFARDLFEMYRRYAERRRWRFEVLETRESEREGFDEVIFLVKADDAWQRLKHEGGPHRVQRVPVTESQGRVHTSSATVTVLPEAEEVEVTIDPNDLRIDVYRSTGPGGQSVNTTDSAVRITHKPTGLVVSMQDEKSQIQNRAKAMQVLRARLLKMEQERQSSAESEQRRSQVGGGGRSEKIRTYNFKENRVTDHRVKLTLYKLDRVLDGELGEITDALIADERERELAAGMSAGVDAGVDADTGAS